MSRSKTDKTPSATLVDPMGARRLKEGLVPTDTGIFVRIEEGPLNAEVGRTFDLSSGGVYLIGREGTDIVLDDDRISRKHAEIGLYGPGAYVLRDLASTNGTLLNGRSVGDRVRLNSGDQITVGDFQLRFCVVEHTIKPS